MKKVWIFLLLTLTCQLFNGALLAQKVGINTTVPLGLLHIKGYTDIPQLIIDANSTQSNSAAPVIKLRTYLGTDLMWINADNPQNIFIGVNAGRSNYATVSYGIDNTFIGRDAGYSNFLASSNTAIGSSTLYSNTSGNLNTALGKDALNSNTTGSRNSALGVGSIFGNTIGEKNTAAGTEALYSNVAGSEATALGYHAMYYANNQPAFFTNYNVAVGFEALLGSPNPSANTGNSNTAMGFESLWSNSMGSSNTAAGVTSLFYNTIGDNNTAYGANTLVLNSKGSNNTACGVEALTANTTAGQNTAMGMAALYTQSYNNGGIAWSSYNTAIGNESLYNNQPTSSNNGIYNTAAGYHSLYSNTVGLGNSGLGVNSLFSNTTGNYNTSMGRGAYFTNVGLDNTTCIGYNSGGVVNANNRIEIGNSSVSWIGGQMSWGTYSDGRIKDNVVEDVPGLAFIVHLRPVTYNLNIHRENEITSAGKKEQAEWNSKYDIENLRVTGFIAQEVEEAAKACGYEFSGVQKPDNPDELYSLRYSDFVMPLVKAVQEQQQQIDQLKNENERLSKMEIELNELKTSIERLKASAEN